MKTLSLLALLLAAAGCRNPQQAALYHVKGMSLAVRGEEFQDYAADYYTLALDADSTWTPSLYARGMQRLRRGDAHGAVADLERLLALSPEDATVRDALDEARRQTDRP